MAAVAVDVADAIVSQMATASAANFFTPLSVAPIRSYAAWDDKLTDETTHRVDVVPKSVESVMMTRGHIGYEVETSVLIRMKVENDDNATIDPLMLLLQRAYELFATSYPGHRGLLTTLPNAVWIPPDGQDGSQIKASYSRSMLRQHRQFSGWIVLVYRIPVAAHQ